jgi:putative ABC transport system permease protein
MFKNYLKTAWRNLKRNKIYSSINIIGLSVGLAVCILIMLYAEHEYSYDKFHAKAKQICWMQAKLKVGNDSMFMMNQSFSSGPSAMRIEPSIESFLRVKATGGNTVIANASSALKFAEQNFIFADSNFFNFFSFKLYQGNKAAVLKAPFSVVLSQNAANKYFGKEDPIGKTIRYNNTYNFVVTGVAEETPSNSSIKYDFVASMSSLPSMSEEKDGVKNDYNAFTTYFLVKKGSSFAKAELAMQQLDKIKYRTNEAISRYIALPIVDIHALSGSSNTKYLYVFPLTAALILLLALVNYMSLSTARSSIRAKEIGVRKAVGAQRKTIAAQFFVESALYTTIGFVLAFIISVLFRNFFFNFLNLNIDGSFLFSAPVLLSYGALFIIAIILSASYPAIILSAFNPVLVLYARTSSNSSGAGIRKLFTVFQFTISIILIICAININRQLFFLRTAETGINKDNVLMVPFSSNTGKYYASFKKEIASLANVQETSVALNAMYNNYDMLAVIPRNSDKVLIMRSLYVDQHFIPMLGLKWKIAPADSLEYLNNSASVIINETAAEKLNLGSDPINKKIDNRYIVAGVLKDFNYTSLESKIEGLCVFVSNEYDTAAKWAQRGGCVFVRLKTHTNTPQLLQQLKHIYEKYDNETPFQYSFMDEAHDAQYKAEDRLAKILNAFTGFTIFIAALGLFGLATFTAAQRTKEIGIRKVLGASVLQVMVLLSKDFIKLVLIAAVVASPIAWYFVNNWLGNFAYRVTISWWVFLGASVLAVAITLFTISFHSIKSAKANPVKSLRSE